MATNVCLYEPKTIDMKSLRVYVAFLLLPLIFIQCEKENINLPEGVDFTCADAPTVCDLTAANGDFAIAFFKQLNSEEESDKNIFVSPFSISTALSMTTNGAAGQTLDDMRNALKIGELPMAQVNTDYKTLLEVLPKLDPQTKLKLAQSIWPQTDYPVLNEFLKLNESYYASEVHPIDFRADLHGAIEKVNLWVSDNTDGLIEDALSELPGNVVMLLINAIYFKGTWKAKFDPELTSPMPFFAPGGATEVDMMHLPEGSFPYFENDLFQAVDLPYSDSIFSMTVFLPKEGKDVEAVISELSPENYELWLSKFSNQNLDLYLPKFKMEYGAKLKRTLSDMGMGLAFSDAADFSKMIDGGGVKIDDVIHKAFVEVNEEGTEAAAVTVVVIIETSAQFPTLFKADHPFFFVIRDNKTNSILFMGKVMNPKA